MELYGKEVSLFNITCNFFTGFNVNNDLLASEVVEQQTRVSYDVNSCLFEDTIFKPKTSSEGEKFLNQIKSFFDQSNLTMDSYWSQIHQPLESTNLHHHGDYDIAFVYYVKVPEKSGNLIFELERLTHHITPKVGEMIIFPAWIKHKVTKNMSNDIRISISGNLKYNPK